MKPARHAFDFKMEPTRRFCPNKSKPVWQCFIFALLFIHPQPLDRMEAHYELDALDDTESPRFPPQVVDRPLTGKLFFS
jgi:hypothetical protein